MDKPEPGTGSIEVPAPRGVLNVPASPLVADALAALDEALGQVQVGWQDGKRLYERRIELLARVLTPETFAMVLDWLSSTRRASTNTQRAYADDLRTVWAPLATELGHDRFWIGCLTPGDVRLWRLGQQRAGVSDRTISRRVNALSSLHKYAAERMDPPPRNPVTEDDRPRIDRHDSSTATPIVEIHDLEKMADAAESVLDLLVLHLLYTLAARVTEICAADLADRREEGRRSYLNLLRKGGKKRLMPLTLTTAELLDAHTTGRTDGPLLLDADGRRLDRHDVDRITSRLGRRAGVLPGRDVTPHVLRAARITHLLDDGVPVADVQAFADHDDPATTLLYWRRRDKTARTARLADAADGLLSRAADRWLHPGGAPRL